MYDKLDMTIAVLVTAIVTISIVIFLFKKSYNGEL